ncbi:hypothetical protein [Kitasatospora azatica]|uniref:hypothetical protein n=1 Tax=Kitasatospora azatica TaxID=58347 RepID=UPI0005617ABC|nr:hypothetical protein [Kitasatospora azatica]
MSRSLRRGGTAAIVLALAAVSLSACSAGNSPETLQIKPDSPATSIGTDLKLNAITLVVDPMQSSGQPGPASVSVNISNTGSAPETLQTVSVSGGNATFQDANGAALPGGIVIPAGGAVLVGGQGNPTAHLTSVALPLGGFAPTTFAFSSAGKVDAQAQVTSASGIYAGYGPAGASASASASGASAGPSASTSASASSSAAGSASPSSSTSGAASGSASPSPSASAH